MGQQVVLKLIVQAASFLSRHPAELSTMTLLEVCVETIDEAIAAADAGAGRLEVCACMSEAGTAPSVGLVGTILESVSIPAFVMIRPRGGDFTYSDNDLEVMRRDIDAMKGIGAHGIVSGVLESTGIVDREATRSLIEVARPLPFTFHRAFDLVPELGQALEVLRTLGVQRVLTSGGASTALVGADAIARLALKGGQTTMVAGGGVRAAHAAELVRASGVTEVHARPTRPRRDPSARTRVLSFGANDPGADRMELDPDAVRALVRALESV
jgi:copper homeostasis protein